jgi:hypothetical protein
MVIIKEENENDDLVRRESMYFWWIGDVLMKY